MRSLGDLRWYEERSNWTFEIELRVQTVDPSVVPAESRWFVLLEPRYPWGQIEIYPSKTGGITQTFPHQNRNHPGDDRIPWRAGNICVRSPLFILGRAGEDPDPGGMPERLLWYVNRAVEWIDRASHGQLLAKGDPFELPQWESIPMTVGYCEDESSFEVWKASSVRFGTAELASTNGRFPFAIRRFLDHKGAEVMAPTWGAAITESQPSQVAGWIKIPSVPIIEPYAAPMTWGGVFSTLQAMGVQVEKLLPTALNPLRDRARHVLLVGFLIPQRVGDPPSLMHWQPLHLPVLAHGKVRGFPRTEIGYWHHDQVAALRSSNTVQWLTGENWHPSALGRRGILAQALRDQCVLLVGCGALGSAIGELLVRGGVRRAVVVDADTLTAGNLVRHSLSLPDVGLAKADALASHLNAISPHARVTAITSSLPVSKSEHRGLIAECDLVLDCTGSDDVLHALSEATLHPARTYASISMGRGAKRLYIYIAQERSFPIRKFQEAVAPWLEQDAAEFGELDFPWEGTGCWHPLFPARADQVWSVAAAAVAELQSALSSQLPATDLLVLERGTEVDGAGTLHRVLSDE